jgi:dipeptidyl aminopeptidase/acylaminoacyl peptidase
MGKFKSILVIFIGLALAHEGEALDIQYGTILSTKGSQVLIQYYGIGKKQNYICNVTTRGCSATKKITLGIAPTKAIKQSIQQELKEKMAGHITLSPSGTLLAYYTGGTDKAPMRTYTVRDLKSDKEYSISSSTSYWDLVEDEGKVFDFSPENTSLAYIDDKDGATALYIADMTKSSDPTIMSTKLSTSAFQVGDFLFTDKDTIYYIGNTKDNPYVWSLYRYNLKTNKDTVLESNVSYIDPLRKIGSSLVFSRLQAKGYGPELYNLTTKKIQQFNVPNIATKRNIIHQEVIKTDTVKGILMTPTKENSSKTYPLIIWLHGGPYRQTSYGYHPFHSYGIYDSILELLRKNNVIVLKLDYSGSFGFGRAFAEGIKGAVGKKDVEDVMNAITYAKNRYHVSDVYMMGNSYGGYLSLKALVEHPDTFTGVVSINGVTDWESLLVKMRDSIFNTEFNGLPDFNNRALYDQASITNKINDIGNQKIDIIAGVADRTIPYWQATDLYDKLKASGKNVNLISYKGEDHVYKEKKTIESLCKELFTFVGVKVDPECSK